MKISKIIKIIIGVKIGYMFIELLHVWSNINLILIIVSFLCFNLIGYNVYIIIKSIYIRAIENIIIKYKYILNFNKNSIKRKKKGYKYIENSLKLYILIILKMINIIKIKKVALWFILNRKHLIIMFIKKLYKVNIKNKVLLYKVESKIFNYLGFFKI